MKAIETVYFSNRSDWRTWLEQNFLSKDDIWLEYPKKQSGKLRIVYNDAVEEALCFGWIDSTVKALDNDTTIQRFCPRRKRSSFSQPNKERLKWLLENEMIHQSIFDDMQKITDEEFVFPDDIISELKTDEEVWRNYQNFSESYKRIRIAYIDTARKNLDEFNKRLRNFSEKTRDNKLINGFGA